MKSAPARASTLRDCKERLLRVLLRIQQNSGRAYRRLMGQWLPRCGRGLASSRSFDVYLNSPEKTDLAHLLADVHVALALQ